MHWLFEQLLKTYLVISVFQQKANLWHTLNITNGNSKNFHYWLIIVYASKLSYKISQLLFLVAKQNDLSLFANRQHRKIPWFGIKWLHFKKAWLGLGLDHL